MPLCSLLSILSKLSLISKQYSCLWLYLTPYPPTSNCTGYLLLCHRLSDSFPEPITGMRLSSLHKKSPQWAHHLLQVPPTPSVPTCTSPTSSHFHLRGIYPCNTSERDGGNRRGSKITSQKPQLPEGSHVWCPMPELSRHNSKTLALQCTWSLNPPHKWITQAPTAANTHPGCTSEAAPAHTHLQQGKDNREMASAGVHYTCLSSFCL